MVADKVITREQLQETPATQTAGRKQHLGELLVRMGFSSQEQVNIALARKPGIPYVKLEEYEMSQSPVSLMPPDVALQYNILPLAIIRGTLIIAMQNPFN